MATSDDTVLTVRLGPELRDPFLSEAAMSDLPPADLLRELVQAFVEERRASTEPLSPGYEAFVRRKVEAARASLRAGHGLRHEDVAAEFAARRARSGVDDR